MYSKPMCLRETLATVRGAEPSKGDDLLGVEVELEGKNLYPIEDKGFMKLWEAVPDGSLKVYNPGEQAIEYRFVIPLNLQDTDSALYELQHHLGKKNVEIFDSGRTSVHVHVNCNNETMAVIYNYLTLSVIFDELLVSQNGQRRIGNNFCLRVKDAEGFVVSLAESVRHYGNLDALQHNNRYSSINPMSLFKFGSVEFRSMECTIDRLRLIHWVKTLLAIKNAARTFANPAEIMGAFSQLGPERFFLNILGPQAIRYMRVPDRHKMLFQGLRLVQEFANAATWEPWEGGTAVKRTRGKTKLIPMSDYYGSLLAAQALQAQQANGVMTNQNQWGSISAPAGPIPTWPNSLAVPDVASEDDDDNDDDDDADVNVEIDDMDDEV